MSRVDMTCSMRVVVKPEQEFAEAFSRELTIARSPAEHFSGTTYRRGFGDVWLTLAEGGPHEMVGVEARDDGLVRVCTPLCGEILVYQDGRQETATGRQLICFDSSRQYRVIMPKHYRLVEVTVPHRLIGVTPKTTRLLTATAWPAQSGLSALLYSYLTCLERHGAEVDVAIDQLGISVAELTAALFAARMKSVAQAPDASRHALMLRIQAFVRDQLANPDLSPDLIARRFGVSLRYLQKMFNEQGMSPARWIRDVRLAKSRTELGDSTFDDLTIAAIGSRSGLNGASHFSRLFRDRYGLTPREYRQRRKIASKLLINCSRLGWAGGKHWPFGRTFLSFDTSTPHGIVILIFPFSDT